MGFRVVREVNLSKNKGVKWSTSLLGIALVIFTVLSSKAIGPTFDYPRKSTDQLLQLLNDADPRKRCSAAQHLGHRFSDPREFHVNTPRPENREEKTISIPLTLVPALSNKLAADTNLSVRLCAVFALRDLRYRTNTEPILRNGLTDKKPLVRLRTSDALVSIARKYKETFPLHVLPVIGGCLTNQDPEIQWQAALLAGSLGPDGRTLIAEKKSRTYAREAIASLRQP